MTSAPIEVRERDLAGREGLRLHADELGDVSGPTVILLHGGGQTRHAWRATARTLAEHGWHVLSVDLRGHGDSEWPEDGNYGLKAFADDVHAIATAMTEPPVLVGASLGGMSSLAAMGTSKGTIARALVLVDVAPKIEPVGAARISDFMTARLKDGFGSLDEVSDAIAVYNPHRPRPTDLSGLEKNLRQREDGRWVWHWDPRLMVASGARGDIPVSHDTDLLQEAARHITVPTLLVRGKSSDLLSEEGAQDLLRLIPHAEYVDVQGAGHMVAGDRNDVFNDAVVVFLERLL